MPKLILRKLHRWLGLLLALPVAMQGVSGAILALEPALTAWPLTANSGASGSVNAIVAAAAAGQPGELRPSRFTAPETPGAPARVTFVPRSGAPQSRAKTVLVDPGSLAVLGEERAGKGLLGTIRLLHTNFLIPDRSGRSVTGWVGVGFLTLALLGTVLWWPRPGRWWAAFVVRPGASGWRLHRDLHGAAGAWTVLMLLAMASTGIALAFPQTFRAAMGLRPGGLAGVPALAAPGAPTAPDFDRAIRSAEAAASGAQVRTLFLPTKPTDALRIALTPDGAEGIARATTVFADPWSGEVLSVLPPASLPVMERAFRWVHDLHGCLGIGPLWRVLAVA